MQVIVEKILLHFGSNFLHHSQLKQSLLVIQPRFRPACNTGETYQILSQQAWKARLGGGGWGFQAGTGAPSPAIHTCEPAFMYRITVYTVLCSRQFYADVASNQVQLLSQNLGRNYLSKNLFFFFLLNHMLPDITSSHGLRKIFTNFFFTTIDYIQGGEKTCFAGAGARAASVTFAGGARPPGRSLCLLKRLSRKLPELPPSLRNLTRPIFTVAESRRTNISSHRISPN